LADGIAEPGQRASCRRKIAHQRVARKVGELVLSSLDDRVGGGEPRVRIPGMAHHQMAGLRLTEKALEDDAIRGRPREIVNASKTRICRYAKRHRPAAQTACHDADDACAQGRNPPLPNGGKRLVADSQANRGPSEPPLDRFEHPVANDRQLMDMQMAVDMRRRRVEHPLEGVDLAGNFGSDFGPIEGSSIRHQGEAAETGETPARGQPGHRPERRQMRERQMEADVGAACKRAEVRALGRPMGARSHAARGGETPQLDEGSDPGADAGRQGIIVGA